MYKLFILIGIFSFPIFSHAKVTRENIQTLALKLKGGDYAGFQNGQICSVSVIDNGGDGSAYSVRVRPSEGTNNFMADFTITMDQEGQISDLGGDSIGENFIQNLTVVRKPNGLLYIRVLNQIGDETASGRCTISTQ